MTSLAALIAVVTLAQGELDVSCADAAGDVPIIGAGRERDARRLFRPHQIRRPIALPGQGEGDSGWALRDVRIVHNRIVAAVSGPDGLVEVVLEPLQCRPDAPIRTTSFAVQAGGGAGVDALIAAVRVNDERPFYRASRNLRPKPRAPPHAPRPGQTEGPTSDSRARDGAWSIPEPLNEHLAALALILALAILCLLVDLPGLLRDSGLWRDPGALRAVALLVGIVLAGAALRVLAGPTFLHEAYPYPEVAYLLDGVRLDSALGDYPAGPQLAVVAVSRMLPATDAYAAWFSANIFLGTLAIPAAFFLGTGVTRQRSAGLVLAAVVAFWPHHIRVSASEVTHVPFVTCAFWAFALAIHAANSGRLRTFAAFCGWASAVAIMRPEAAVLGLPLAILVVGAGPGVRHALRSWRVVPLLALVAGFVWLLLPQLLVIMGSESTTQLVASGSTTEALDISSFTHAVSALIVPDGRNALWHPLWTPIWLWPLAMWGFWVSVRSPPRRWLAIGLFAGVFVLHVIYADMPPAETAWPLARYHSVLIPPAAGLVLLGLWEVLARWPRSAGRMGVAGGAVAVAGLLWWPAVAAVPRDHQLEAAWAVELGRRYGERFRSGARLVVPDNRRRFRDLNPRDVIEPLSGGGQHAERAVTVAHAVERLHLADAQPEAYFHWGLYCYLAVGPDEPVNPQCAAMRQTFELEPVDLITIDAPVYNIDYPAVRAAGPLTIGLYRIGGRLLSPEEARRLVPEEIAPGNELLDPMSSNTPPRTDPPEPPL